MKKIMIGLGIIILVFFAFLLFVGLWGNLSNEVEKIVLENGDIKAVLDNETSLIINSADDVETKK